MSKVENESNEMKGKKLSSQKKKPFNPRKVIKASNPQFKQMYKSVSPELQKLIDSVIDPDSVVDCPRWPNTYGLSSTYKSITTLQAQFDAYGQSVLLVYPKLTDAIYATAGMDYNQTLTVSGTPAGNYFEQNIELDSTHDTVQLGLPFMFADQHAALSQPFISVGSQNLLLYPISWNSTKVTPLINFQFTNISSGDAGVLDLTVRWHNVIGGILHQTTFVVPANGLVSTNLNPVAATNITAYMSFTVSLGANIKYSGKVTGQLRETGAAPYMEILLPNVATHCLVYDINSAATIVNSAEEFFVLGQSVLCTYQGSTLEDGGLASICRLPSNTIIGEKSDVGAVSNLQSNPYYDFLASIANNRYDGPLKDGLYSFYLGEDESNYFYRPVEDAPYPDVPYIAAAYSTTGATFQNLYRIKIITHVQFLSNNNIYSQAPSPYMRDLKLLHNVLSMVPASYCNPLHKKQIADYLKKVGKRIGTVVSNPQNWLSAAKIAADILL